MTDTQQVETELAIIARTGPNVVETHIKQGVRITEEGMRENIRQRRALCGDSPHVMLTVLPADATFDMGVMRSDMFKYDGLRANIRAIAVVAPTAMAEMAMKLYFGYFPQVFRTQVFSREPEARAWLEQQLAASL